MKTIHIAFIIFILSAFQVNATELLKINDDVYNAIASLKNPSPEQQRKSFKTIAKLVRTYSNNNDQPEMRELLTNEITKNYDIIIDAYYKADRSLIVNMLRNDIVTIISISDSLKKRTVDDVISEAQKNINSKAYLRSNDGYPRSSRAWGLIEALIANKDNHVLFHDQVSNLEPLYQTGHHFITYPVSKLFASLDTPETKAILTKSLSSKNPQVRADSANVLSNLDAKSKSTILDGLHSNNPDKIDAALSFIRSNKKLDMRDAKRLNEIAWDASFDRLLKGRAINAMGHAGLPSRHIIDYLIRIINEAPLPFLQSEALFALEQKLNEENNTINTSKARTIPIALGRISDYKSNWIATAIPSIVQSLKHKEKSVRKAAIMTLGQAGHNAYEHWHILMEVYITDSDLREFISRSVNQIHDTILAMAVDFDLDEQTRLQSITKIGDFSAKLWTILSTHEAYYPFLYEMPNTTESILDITRFND